MIQNRYKACYMKDLAEAAGCEDLRTFQNWLTPNDLKAMIDIGWNPFARKLKPRVVEYLRNQFIDTHGENLSPNAPTTNKQKQ